MAIMLVAASVALHQVNTRSLATLAVTVDITNSDWTSRREDAPASTQRQPPRRTGTTTAAASSTVSIHPITATAQSPPSITPLSFPPTPICTTAVSPRYSSLLYPRAHPTPCIPLYPFTTSSTRALVPLTSQLFQAAVPATASWLPPSPPPTTHRYPPP
ncbi:hypothetical protein I4F81_010573 [Pyropia yezoensis]|uniref:Uncharacterized protein n=1 Tax=Pyropia yezoensis TaxID=2788 RepID=A0ACC3CE77_PYRYE|nr:hypothetical protein I4F81_010573 [Neopyropia yezoensis]